MCQFKLSKIWKRTIGVAIPKSMKPLGNSKSCRLIPLICFLFKIKERFVYARVEPIIDPLLPKKQAMFQRQRSTVNQVTLVTQEIELSFLAQKKAGTVFSILLQPAILHGTAASCANYSIFFQTGTSDGLFDFGNCS